MFSSTVSCHTYSQTVYRHYWKIGRKFCKANINVLTFVKAQHRNLHEREFSFAPNELKFVCLSIRISSVRSAKKNTETICFPKILPKHISYEMEKVTFSL